MIKGKEKKPNNNNNSNDTTIHIDPIPIDLTVEILTRLPLKSLLKFQYVSKAWCSIIRTKDFINTSVSMSLTPSQPKLLITFKNGEINNDNTKKGLFFFTSSQYDSSSSSMLANLDMTMTSMDAYFYTRCAPVNGFICISHKGSYMICNPSSKQVITLPEIAGPNWKSANKYLGYDPINDEYKAMCKRVSNFQEDQEHMVLTLGEIAKVIVCFDVRSERIRFIKPPSISSSNENTINYKGKLAIVDFCLDGKFVFEILHDVDKQEWLRKTCSVSTWGSRHVWLDSLSGLPRTCHGITKNGELVISTKVLSRDRDFYIFLCDIVNRKIRTFKLEGVEDVKSRYGVGEINGSCHVYISPDYGEKFSFL
ncbi:unnamed protein product [Cochlearia groenlandica]